MGERFTQAEISVFPRVTMYAFIGLPVDARFPNVTRWMSALAARPSFARSLSDADRQLLRLSSGGLLPWLRRTLRKPNPSWLERVRLALVRRAARRTMAPSQAAPAEARRGGAVIRQPSSGAIPPSDRTVRSGPPPEPDVLAEPLILYDDPISPHSRRIRILLREKGLTWQTVEVPLHRLAHKSPEYLAINPNGELPALRHGGRVLYDSQLIAEYVDRTYRGHPIYPNDAFHVAQVRMWMALEAGTHKELRPLFYLGVIRPQLLAAGVNEDTLASFVAPGVHRSNIAWLRDTLRGSPRFDTSEPLAREAVRATLDFMERHLRGRAYLVAERLTMADLAWFSRVDVLPQLGVILPVKRYPNVTRWHQSIAARASARDAAPRALGNPGHHAFHI